MSTTSHKSRTRLLSESAMKGRVHTSRAARTLTKAGKTKVKKVHSEAQTLKARAKARKTKFSAAAKSARTSAS